MADLADVLRSNDSQVTVASGDSLDVRTVRITEGVSSLFRIELTAVSRNQDIDFSEVVGCAASFSISRRGTTRAWDGVVDDIEQTRVESAGLATYAFSIVPKLWLATQRQNYRIFQYLSELDIVQQLLGEHGVLFTDQTHLGYKPRKFVMQYGESDFAFISRMLESIGVAYAFEPGDDGITMVLSDGLESRRPTVEPLPFFDEPPETAPRWASQLSVRQRVRPGKRRVQDLDYRKPS
ncbi:MAG: type VI secretion system tip protein VgrG, partial [Myxococcales bacterium]|nr:type VI secretion system tip protein VgrG [Myxococcales bacterium]